MENYKNTSSKGAASELIACSWLLRQGYEVFRNVSPSGPMDLVAFNDGSILKVDVKTIQVNWVTGDEYTVSNGNALRKEQSESNVRLLFVEPEFGLVSFHLAEIETKYNYLAPR